MRIFYVANIRIPTEKAHGVAIVRSCESFGKSGVETTLIVPRRRTPFEKDVFETYCVDPVFGVTYLPTLDLISENANRLIFWVQTVTFQISLFFYLLFNSRDTILYTRDPGFMLLSLLGYRVVFECHLIPKNRTVFFALVRKAHRVIVISEALKKAFVEAGFESRSVLVAPSGVDLEVFDIDVSQEKAREILDLPQKQYIGVYTGNFTTMGKDKGISDILKSLTSCPEVLFVAAGGSDKDRARYEREAMELGVGGRVILRGSTTQKNLALYQKAADVLLMPFPDTPHYRNHMSPVKMFEYMAARRLIIATGLPTIREVLDEESAYIVPPGDTAALAAALHSIGNSNTNNLADTAYDRVKSNYSWRTRTERILKHIKA